VRPSNHLETTWLDSPGSELGQLHASEHHPNGGAQHRFDEGQIKEMVLRWQDSREPALLDEILRRCEPALTGTILAHGDYSMDFDESLNALRIRLWRKLPKYDHSKGRIFTFVSLIGSQGITEIRTKRNRMQQRFPEASIELLDCLQYSHSNGNDDISRAAALDDIVWRVSQTRTICTDPHELQAQRWLVKGMLDSEFRLRRHQAADSMRIVYGLDWARSRQLHDYTVLETRRQLLDVVKVPVVTRRDLIGTRGHGLSKYCDQLSADDFSRLAFLMRGLSPVAIIKGPLDWTLNGHPLARPLFDCG
jgi:hypothetical protein